MYNVLINRKIWSWLLFCFMFIGCGVLLLFSLLPLRFNFCLFTYDSWVWSIILIVMQIYGIVVLNKSVKKEHGKLMSSNITAFYKFFIPLIFLICLIANNLLLVLKWFRPEDLPVFIFFDIVMIIFSSIFLPCLRLKALYIVDQNIVISNFLKEETYCFSNVIDFDRYTRFFFRLTINKNGQYQYYYFFPHILEEFAKLYKITKKTEMEELVEILKKIKCKKKC